MKKVTRSKLAALAKAGSIMVVGLLLLKLLPMRLFGETILFDASAHVTVAMFCLYVLWFFIDQNRGWRMAFLVFALVVISIISLQRILANAHNDLGLLLGFLLSSSAIIFSQKKYFKDKFRF